VTAKEIFNYLLSGAIAPWDDTCDLLISGDENKVVNKIGTCFKLTARLIETAKNEKVDMIITHEPTYVRGNFPSDDCEYDLMKKQMLEESGITVYRLHDHAHHRENDYIHAGFIESLGLKIKRKYERESLGVCRYELDEELTTRELGLRINKILGVETVRIVGKDDYPLKTVCLALGGVGYDQLKVLFDPGCDLFITGELGEVREDEYVRDACYFGANKSVLILGHYGAEYAGMRYLAKELTEKIAPAIFLEGGEVYHGL